MKILFFTSNTKHYHKVDGEKIANEIDNSNRIVDQLKENMASTNCILFISADSSNSEKVDSYSKLLFDGLKLSGFTFNEYLILDDRTIDSASQYVSKADVIFLSGGDTFLQNKFFKRINLKELLYDFNGIIIGQSAGSINMATSVYNSPEEGELSEPIYFEGLGLSEINIEPHFCFDSSNFDENEIYQRKHMLEESKKRPIYALCDGAHIKEDENEVTIYGKSYLIKDGVITLVCKDLESVIIQQKSKLIK